MPLAFSMTYNKQGYPLCDAGHQRKEKKTFLAMDPGVGSDSTAICFFTLDTEKPILRFTLRTARKTLWDHIRES